MASTPSTDADATRSDGLAAFGTLLVVIALLGALSNGRGPRTVWRRDRGSTSRPESRAASLPAGDDRQRA